jgi:hypothetical protein
MAKVQKKLAGKTAENSKGLLTNVLAEERDWNWRSFWRLGSWAVSAIGAIAVAFFALHTSATLRQEQIATADVARQQIETISKQDQVEMRRLSAALSTLNSDRDRLYARITVLEQGLDSVTGSVGRQTPQPSSLVMSSAAQPVGLTAPPVIATPVSLPEPVNQSASPATSTSQTEIVQTKADQAKANQADTPAVPVAQAAPAPAPSAKEPSNKDAFKKEPLNRESLNKEPLNKEPPNKEQLNNNSRALLIDKEAPNKDVANKDVLNKDALNRDALNRTNRELPNKESLNREASNKEPPSKELPGKEALIKESPIMKEAPLKEASLKEAPIKEAANGETSKRDALSREALNREAANREASNREALAKEIWTKETPGKEASSREVSSNWTKQASANEAPKEAFVTKEPSTRKVAKAPRKEPAVSMAPAATNSVDARAVSSAPPAPSPNRVAPRPPVVVASASAETDAAADDQNNAPEVAVSRTEFGVDLGGANSVDGLRALWQGVVQSNGSLLDGLHPIMVLKEGRNGLGLQLRLVAGPVSDAATVAKVCAVLMSRNRACDTAVFDGQRLALEAADARRIVNPVRGKRSMRHARREEPVAPAPQPQPQPVAQAQTASSSSLADLFRGR